MPKNWVAKKLTISTKKLIKSSIFALICAFLLISFAHRISITRLLVYAAITFFIYLSAIYALKSHSQKIYKFTLIGWGVLIVFLTLSLFLNVSGYSQIFSNEAFFKSLLDRAGGFAAVAFIFISFLQVTILPIPSTITILIGVSLFGIWQSAILSFVGILIGSVFAFFLGKTFGVRLVKWIAGENAIQKYKHITGGRDGLIFFFMILLPFFPDDILCLVAGMSDMSYTKFLIIQLIARPPGILVVAALGTGAFNIPFAGWGILVWIIAIIAIIYMIFALFKYSGSLIQALRDSYKNLNRAIYGAKVNFSAVEPQDLSLIYHTQIRRLSDIYIYNTKSQIYHQRQLQNRVYCGIINNRCTK